MSSLERIKSEKRIHALPSVVSSFEVFSCVSALMSLFYLSQFGHSTPPPSILLIASRDSILVRNDSHPRKVLKILNVGRTSQEHPIFRDSCFEGKPLEPLRRESAFDEEAVDLGGSE